MFADYVSSYKIHIFHIIEIGQRRLIQKLKESRSMTLTSISLNWVENLRQAKVSNIRTGMCLIHGSVYMISISKSFNSQLNL